MLSMIEISRAEAARTFDLQHARHLVVHVDAVDVGQRFRAALDQRSADRWRCRRTGCAAPRSQLADEPANSRTLPFGLALRQRIVGAVCGQVADQRIQPGAEARRIGGVVVSRRAPFMPPSRTRLRIAALGQIGQRIDADQSRPVPTEMTVALAASRGAPA